MNHVVNLRGTSGSGKTFIVKHVMSCYEDKLPHYIVGRKQPIGYTLRNQKVDSGTCMLCLPNDDGVSKNPYCPVCRGTGSRQFPPLFVAGHYEGACGGCDNLSQGLDYIYELIHQALEREEDVIFEGLIVASDWRRCVELRRKSLLLIIGLDTSLEECNRSVDARRAERAERRGKEAPPLRLDPDGQPKNTRAKFNALLTQRKHFKIPGVDFRVLNRANALDATLQHLGLAKIADYYPAHHPV